LSSCFFGVGVFIYIALWIALPAAESDQQRREMYGTMNNLANPAMESNIHVNKVGHAFDAVFRAIGKVLFVIVRIFLIIFGICFVLTGFLTLVTFIMITVFNYPGAFSTDAVGINISYLPDFLNYTISTNLVPWVKGLIAMVVCIPLLALVYAGVRLIFWFRARDGFVWLTALVLWVMSAAALSIMLFNEGIGFAEKSSLSHQEYLSSTPDTLFIKAGSTISDLKIDKEIVLPDEENEVFYINDEKKEIYFRTSLDIHTSDDNKTSVEIFKSSAGRSRLDAEKKSERLMYNTSVKGNTLYLDEYFTIPTGTKWSLDFVSVLVRIPEGTIIYMDKTVEKLYHSYNDDDFVNDPVRRYWMMTEDGPDYIDPDRDSR
jgi:hypothetical protein